MPGAYITEDSIDASGRQIKVGDRIENLSDPDAGGIVVGVFGGVLVYCLDWTNNGFASGDFLYANCDECRVLLPVTSVAKAVAEIRRKRKQTKPAEA